MKGDDVVLHKDGDAPVDFRVEDGDAKVGLGVEDDLNIPLQENKDRRLVLHGGGGSKYGLEEEDDEEEFVFDDEEDAQEVTTQWRAIARFYSGQVFKTWVLFNELNKVWGNAQQLPVRELGDNRFLVEFDSL